MQYLIELGVIGMLVLYTVIVMRCMQAPEW
jgi:hypothetical protein